MAAAFAINVNVRFLFNSTSPGFLPSAPCFAPSFASPLPSSLETHGKFQTILLKPFSVHFLTRLRKSPVSASVVVFFVFFIFFFAASITLSFNFAASTPCNTTTSSYFSNSFSVARTASLPYVLSKLSLVSCVVAMTLIFFFFFFFFFFFVVVVSVSSLLKVSLLAVPTRVATLKENVKSPSPTVKIRSPFSYSPIWLSFSSSSSSWPLSVFFFF